MKGAVAKYVMCMVKFMCVIMGIQSGRLRVHVCLPYNHVSAVAVVVGNERRETAGFVFHKRIYK